MLAICGVWEGDFTAKNLPIQRRKCVCCLRVNKTEKLQFVDVKVADGLHYGKLRHHLDRTYRKGGVQINEIKRYVKDRLESYLHQMGIAVQQALYLS